MGSRFKHAINALGSARSWGILNWMRTDYHMHTPLCGHATGAPRDYVLAAQKAGLVEIGFSDHNPMPTQFDDWRMAPDQLPQYVELIEEARREFPRYPIRLGDVYKRQTPRYASGVICRVKN